MKTYFAPPGRSRDDELAREIEAAGNNFVIDEVLHSIGGVIAVLNAHRQIVAVNDGLIEMLGIPHGREILGLRPGEMVHCIHAQEMEAGCGTSRACASCGAAISIVASLATNKAEEATCALTVRNGGKRKDMYFRVRCAPVMHSETRLLLLFLQDISYPQRLAALERVFFHDINNIVATIVNATHILANPEFDEFEDKQRLLETTRSCSVRLANEIQIQRCMSRDDGSAYRLAHDSLPVGQVLQDLEEIFSANDLVNGKRLSFQKEVPPVHLVTDASLLVRVLNNIITNALEATPRNREVRVWVEQLQGKVRFCVWNEAYIVPEVAARVFQRNFSTKAKMGRGYGTYSMKFFGEEILGGEVGFTTSIEEGTTFRFTLENSGDEPRGREGFPSS
ncbi:MAG TPA: PAS domain-containing sensor histidine kinase [Syntrophorhabdaceae bacterium]|jgi:hypothetical protein